ncbi:MAG: 50S ribosomal protein L5 [Candidatus Hydrogenedentota bacterium]
MVAKKYVPRIKKKYYEEVVPELKKRLKRENVLSLPRLKKIVVNMGVGDALKDPKTLDGAMKDLRDITGQQPIITRAKKSVSNFKLRAGQSIGCCVTLTGNKMYEFFDRFVNFAIPRIRDFKGLDPKSFDKRGNYNLGIKEQTIFPEVSYDSIYKIRGMDVAVVTSSDKDGEAMLLLALLGFPFKKT